VKHRGQPRRGGSQTPYTTPSGPARGGSFPAQHRLEKEPVARISLQQQALPAPRSGVRIWHGCGDKRPCHAPDGVTERNDVRIISS